MSIVNINIYLERLNKNFILIFLGRLSILVLLLHNQNILHLYHKNLLYYIIIISMVQLIYSLIINIINIYVIYYGKNIELQKNHLNLIFNILKILGLLVLLNKIYKNNSEYILYSEIFLYFLFYFLISSLMTYSKFLIFKTEFFKGISILNIFHLYRLRASNISNINTDENKDKVLDIKENIDIEPKIINNTTNIGVHIHAEDLINSGFSKIGKIIESCLRSVTQAASQIGLTGSITGGMAVGAKITALSRQ